MIKKFVEAWDARKGEVEAHFESSHPSYSEIVKAVVSILGDEDDWESPDPSRITCIDHGDWQGTLLFVIGARGYQPSDFWYVKVSYGSCSGCDTLQAIRDESWEDEVTPSQLAGYMTLALHILQGIKPLGGAC